MYLLKEACFCLEDQFLFNDLSYLFTFYTIIITFELKCLHSQDSFWFRRAEGLRTRRCAGSRRPPPPALLMQPIRADLKTLHREKSCRSGRHKPRRQQLWRWEASGCSSACPKTSQHKLTGSVECVRLSAGGKPASPTTCGSSDLQLRLSGSIITHQIMLVSFYP